MPPDVGSEVTIRETGYVTRHNDDGSFNWKKNKKRGAPFKKTSADLVTPALPLIAAIPVPPPVADHEPPAKRGKGRVVAWGVAGIGSAIGVGIFHGIGARMLDAVWPYIERFLSFAM